jgi:hypothetical protein
MKTGKGVLHAEKSRILKLTCIAAATAAIATGAAYADNEWTGANIVDGSISTLDIVDGTVSTVDIKDGSVTTTDIKDGSVTTADLADESVTNTDIKNGTIQTVDLSDNAITSVKILDGTIGAADIQSESITNAQLATDSVQATEMADNSIDSGEIIDFGLSNEDIGVLEAQVNADGTLASSDHFGTTSVSLGTGSYQVDFGVNISSCTFVATQGESGVGGAGGAIMGVTDRAGNANAAFVTSRDAAGAGINTAFQMVVVC